MGRIDPALLARQQRQVAANVGETAIYRCYVSASAGSPQYGIGDADNYVERIVTGLFQSVLFNEQLVPGGQFVAGDMIATLIDCTPSSRDEIIWRGVTYRLESETTPQQIVGTSALRVLLRRGQPTGG